MFVFLNSAPNLPFSIALAIMILITLTEGAAFLLGISLSDVIENGFLSNNFESTPANLETTTLLGKTFSWFKIGQIPVLILLIMFLAIFGTSGLIFQAIFLRNLGYALPVGFASALTLVTTVPILRILGKLLNNIMPKDETSAVSFDTFIGRMTIITLGTARLNHAAQAKVKDSYGKHHYIMVEPDNSDEEFKQGENILIVRRKHNLFYVIENKNFLI